VYMSGGKGDREEIRMVNQRPIPIDHDGAAVGTDSLDRLRYIIADDHHLPNPWV